MHTVHITVHEHDGTAHTGSVATDLKHSELSLRLLDIFDTLDEYNLDWRSETYDDEVYFTIDNCHTSVARRVAADITAKVKAALT